MNRRHFILGSRMLVTSTLADIFSHSKTGQPAGLPRTDKMPVMFVGHGSPLHAITQDRYHLQ